MILLDTDTVSLYHAGHPALTEAEQQRIASE
jgi:hypothetical protein